MPIHVMSIGIEANSKEDAEKKLLKFQQIATEYKKPDESTQQEPLPVYKKVLGAIAQIGLLFWLERHRYEQQLADESMTAKKRKDAWLLRKREREKRQRDKP